jgi:hypothetical protein
VEWGAVFAGAAIATAFGLILLAFGAALGLTMTSPFEGEGMSPMAFAIAAGLYLVWVQIMSFYLGGYVTARLRTRIGGVSEHEIDVRDGLHGLIMWAVGVIAAGVIAFAGIGGIGATAHAPNPVLASVAQVTTQQVNESAAAEAVVNPAAQDATTEQRRAEIARKLAVISAFISAASLLVSAVAAFYGAHSGGHHRDKLVKWDFFASRARPLR